MRVFPVPGGPYNKIPLGGYKTDKTINKYKHTKYNKLYMQLAHEKKIYIDIRMHLKEHNTENCVINFYHAHLGLPMTDLHTYDS